MAGIIKNTGTIKRGVNTFSSNEVQVVKADAPTLLKIVTTPYAEVFNGSIISYGVTVSNPNNVALDEFEFIDMIDSQTVYVAGSLKVNGVSVTPTETSPELKAPAGVIPANGSIDVTFDVSVF
jgi:uncharacterized repeat protein (TIGR01451 family)